MGGAAQMQHLKGHLRGTGTRAGTGSKQQAGTALIPTFTQPFIASLLGQPKIGSLAQGPQQRPIARERASGGMSLQARFKHAVFSSPHGIALVILGEQRGH